MVRYLLPESTITIDGTVDLVVDTRLGADIRQYLDKPRATVTQSVRGDKSHGERVLTPPTRGDNAWTVDLTTDDRLTSVSYNSVGVGSKVVGTGVKVLATVAGAALRTVGSGGARSLAGMTAVPSLTGSAAPPRANPKPPTEAEARAAWEEGHAEAMAHAQSYNDLADEATRRALEVRTVLVSSEDPLNSAVCVRRLRQLEDLRTDALAESAKVEGLYRAWSDGHIERHPQKRSVTFSIDELPIHEDPASYEPQLANQSGSPGLVELWTGLWDDLGTRVEIGPVPPERDWRPNHDGIRDGSASEDAVHWRIPRLARIWVWRRGESANEAVLESATDTLVTDRYSKGGWLNLEGRWFGEASIQLTLGDLGAPVKMVVGDKSAIGAIADAIAAAPDQFAAGLDVASKASNTWGDLSSAGAEQQLKAVTRQVDQRTKELELQGINATADSFAALKELKQKVELAEAQSSLAPPSDLTKLQDELARATAARDLETISRDRVQAADLAAMRSEIERITVELALIKLQKEGL